MTFQVQFFTFLHLSHATSFYVTAEVLFLHTPTNRQQQLPRGRLPPLRGGQPAPAQPAPLPAAPPAPCLSLSLLCPSVKGRSAEGRRLQNHSVSNESKVKDCVSAE